MVFVQGNHLHRSKIPFFRAVRSTVLWNFPYFIALGSLFSQSYRFHSLQTNSVTESVTSWSPLKTNKEARLVERSVCVHAQLCPILCDPMDCSPSSSSVHGILQARLLEWVAIPFSRGYSRPRDQTWISALQADSLPSELPERSYCLLT